MPSKKNLQNMLDSLGDYMSDTPMSKEERLKRINEADRRYKMQEQSKRDQKEIDKGIKNKTIKPNYGYKKYYA